MKNITIKIANLGHEFDLDLRPAEIINNIKKTHGEAVFYDSVCEIFNELEIEPAKLTPEHVAIIRHKVVELTKNVGLHYEQIAKDFFNWAVNVEVDYSLPDFSIDTIWKQFLTRP